MTAAANADLSRRIRVARGDEPGDIVITGGDILNVFTGRIEPGNIVIADGFIAGNGLYDFSGAETIDARGRTVIPGLIDAHMHVESTLLTPAQLAPLVVPHGASMLIADPHEIANVLGAAGVKLMIDASQGLPLDIHYMAPSCVPSVDWENAGAVLDADAIAALFDESRVLGLAEMMNFPGVIGAAEPVLKKIDAAHRRQRIVDGHAPGLTGQDLVAYAAAGIRSDHESTTADEALAKAALGMLIQVREGSIARNLDAMLPLIVDDRLGDWCLCTDDIHPDDLVEHGHIDGLLRRVVAAGVEPARAVKHATLIPARHYGFTDRGALAPSYRADVVIVDDLQTFSPHIVLHRGEIVARDGEYLAPPTTPAINVDNTINLAPLDASAFSLELSGEQSPVIGIVPDQIVTRNEVRSVRSDDRGRWEWDSDADIALLANIERHRATGNIGLGLVEGFAFREHGAIASSVAHDCHNLIIAGTNAPDMLAAARRLEETGGGFVVVRGGEPIATVKLPLAGLMSTGPASEVISQLRDAREAARALGCGLSCPFGSLSFLALVVIPELKISDQGLFDVGKQSFVRV